MTKLAPVTSPTLLGRLQTLPLEEQAWTEFVLRYGDVIFSWCRKWNLQDADARDATQSVLLKLVRKLGTYQYDTRRSFRNWLQVVTRHVILDWHEEQVRKRAKGIGGRDNDVFAEVVAQDDLLTQLNATFDLEIFEEACSRVRMRVSPHVWEAFHLTAIEQISGADAAEQLDMKIGNVFMARCSVQKLLRETIRRLEAGTIDNA